jgi:hypothetical protein
MARLLFIRLIIRLFQLVFSAGTVFFSHNKSANSVFQPAYQHSRTAPKKDLEPRWLGGLSPVLPLSLSHSPLYIEALCTLAT